MNKQEGKESRHKDRHLCIVGRVITFMQGGAHRQANRKILRQIHIIDQKYQSDSTERGNGFSRQTYIQTMKLGMFLSICHGRCTAEEVKETD